MTGKKIEKNEDQHYLVLNNFKLFDNCFISKEAVDDLGFEECFRITTEKCKRLKEIDHERKQLRMDFSLTND